MEEYEIFEGKCPHCEHTVIHQIDCTYGCENGWFDDHDEDPLNYYPGESESKCMECLGTGFETWCANCGANLSGLNVIDDDPFEPIDPNQISLFHNEIN